METDYKWGMGQLYLDLNGLPISDRAILRLKSLYDELLALTRSCLDHAHQDFSHCFSADRTLVRGLAKDHFEKIGLPWPVIGCHLKLGFDVTCLMDLRGRHEVDVTVIDYEIRRNSHIVLKTEEVAVGEATVEKIVCFTFGESSWYIPAIIRSDGWRFYPGWEATLIEVFPAERSIRKPRSRFVDEKRERAYLKLLLPYGSTLSDSDLERIKQAFSYLESEMRKYLGDMVETKFVKRETFVSGNKSHYLEAFGLPEDIVGRELYFWLPNVAFDPDGYGLVYGEGLRAQVADVTVIRDHSVCLDFAQDIPGGTFSVRNYFPRPDAPGRLIDHWQIESTRGLNNEVAILKTQF